MAWYWIVCIVFGYVLLGAITGEVWDIIAGCDEDFKIVALFFWPLLMAVGIIIGLFELIQALGKFLVNTILARIENKEKIDDIDYDRRKR